MTLMKRIIFMGIVFGGASVWPAGLEPSVQGSLGYQHPLSPQGTLNGALSVRGALLVNPPFSIPHLSRIELSVRYATFGGKKDSSIKMTWLPVLVSGIGYFDLESTVWRPYVKIGVGLVFESLTDNAGTKFQTDPGFVGGLGMNLKLGSGWELKAESSYLFVYQTHAPGATVNGSSIDVDLALAYRFGL